MSEASTTQFETRQTGDPDGQFKLLRIRWRLRLPSSRRRLASSMKSSRPKLCRIVDSKRQFGSHAPLHFRIDTIRVTRCKIASSEAMRHNQALTHCFHLDIFPIHLGTALALQEVPR